MKYAIDTIIAVMVISTLYAGVKAGGIKTFFMIMGFVVGMLLGSTYADEVGQKLFRFSVRLPLLYNLLGFLVILGVTLIIFLIISFFISRLLKLIFSEWLNKGIGGILGFGAGVVITVISLWVVGNLYRPIRKDYKNAIFASQLIKLTRKFTGDTIFSKDYFKIEEKEVL